jgi:hypothetical protein
MIPVNIAAFSQRSDRDPGRTLKLVAPCDSGHDPQVGTDRLARAEFERQCPTEFGQCPASMGLAGDAETFAEELGRHIEQ